MKYLAFGLLIALLLDATVIRMFLVPAVMKLLGDDCWWAPQWMKRVQERIGLGEVELPDERKRPVVRETEGEVADQAALVGAGAPAQPGRHDPGHPAAIPAPVTRGSLPPVRPTGPSAAGTTRIPTAPPAGPPPEPPTTRFAAQPDSAATTAINAINAPTDRAPTERAPRVDPSPGRERREIESWLGELRGSTPTTAIPTPTPAPPARPSAEQTRAIPDPAASEPTTAIPAQQDSAKQDPESTEKIDTRDTGETPTRRGGGVSAADLLRREGRL
jgi:RND superfamily putative drug exporter